MSSRETFEAFVREQWRAYVEQTSGAPQPGTDRVGEGRVRYINPDCGFWMLKRSIADAKIRALVAGRDLYEGRTVPA